MRAARCLAIGLWVACLVLRLSLPAWEICWHRDGQICDEAVPRSCCGAEAPESAPADEDCADCTDLRLEPGANPQRVLAMSDARADVGLVSSTLVHEALVGAAIDGTVPYSGAAPPAGPRLHDTLPLRC